MQVGSRQHQFQQSFAERILPNSIPHYQQNQAQEKNSSNSGSYNNIRKPFKKKGFSKYGSAKRRCYNRFIRDSAVRHKRNSKFKKLTPSFKGEKYNFSHKTKPKANRTQRQLMAGIENGFAISEPSETEIIQINSDNESAGSDVVALQPTPPPVVILSDSDEGNIEKTLPENHPNNLETATSTLSDCSIIQFEENTLASQTPICNDNRRYGQELPGMEYNSSERYNKQPIVDLCDEDEDDAIESRYPKKTPICTENYVNKSNNSNENANSSHDEEQSFPSYILPGPAVEHYKSLKRKSTSLSKAKANEPKTPKCMKIGPVTNSEFMNTLYNLKGANNTTRDDSSDESDDCTLTARDIAEKLLTKQSPTASDKKTTNEKYMMKEFAGNQREKILTNAKTLSQSQNHSTQQTSPPMPRIEFNNTQLPTYYVVYAYYQKDMQGGFGWNEEMRNFYNKTWNGEGFMLSKILEKMDPDKHLWKICNEDRFRRPLTRHRYFKCDKCCSFGRVNCKCNRPKRPLLCYMCGAHGHFEKHCPNTICLRCGSKTRRFTKNCKGCNFQRKLFCANCKTPGHSSNNCPDNWRRYHSTVEANASPNVTISYNAVKSCCVCGARDHLPENCQSAKVFAEYPITSSDIKSHQKTYDDICVKPSHQYCISFNLLYNPSANFEFKFAEDISHERWYGRFLQAVGMDFRLKNACPLRGDLLGGTNDLKSSVSYTEGDFNRNTANSNQRNEESIDNITIAETENEHMGDKCTGIISVEELNNSIHPIAFSNEYNSQVQTQDVDNQQFLSVEPHSKYNVVGQGHKSCYGNECDSTDITTQVQYVRDIRPFQAGEHPDYIPLTTTKNKNHQNRANSELCNLNNVENVNVGSIFVASLNDNADKHSNDDLAAFGHLHSEAKIYLLRSHSRYLLSPEGQLFLTAISQSHDIKARLEWSSVGHILFISGSQINQEKFHQKLLAKCNSLSGKGKFNHSQNRINIPRRGQVLIRFLKENIGELLNNLGDANKLYNRLKFLEKQHSKNSSKVAAKTRRTLNMILLGKAGLLGGDTRLDKLLQYLKILTEQYAGDIEVPIEIRSEIGKHWKYIFTSQDHGSYNNIIRKYNQLVCKNRLAKLSLDPLLFQLK